LPEWLPDETDFAVFSGGLDQAANRCLNLSDP
jgi:hypothetical protein